MKFSFPSINKKVAAVIATGVVIIIAVITVDSVNKSKTAKLLIQQNNNETSLEVRSLTDNNFTIGREGSFIVGDTDEDGLMDWEEEIRGTSPNNKDTDGDGTSDKDEVGLNRDPLLAGPDDSILPSDQIPELFATISYKEGTLSDQVGKTFIENYLKIGKGEENQSNFKEFSKQLASEAATVGKIKDAYTEIDFKTFPNFETAKTRQYGNLLALYTLDYQSEISKINLDSVSSKTLDTIFTTHLSRLKNMAVPRDAVENHTKYTNAINKIKQSFSLIRNNNEDPLRAYYALQEYAVTMQQMPILYRTIAHFFEDSGIIFSTNELGTFWQNI